MDFGAIEEGIRDWFADTAGISVVMLDAAEGGFRPSPCGLLAIGAIADLEREESWHHDSGLPAGADMVPTYHSLRRMTVSFMVDTLNQKGALAPRWYLSRVMSRLRSTRARATFADLGLAVASAQAIVDASYDADGRRRARAVLDVEFFAAVNDSPTSADNSSYIATAEVTSDIDDVDGSPISASLQLDQESMP